jgi:hypothetical protein
MISKKSVDPRQGNWEVKQAFMSLPVHTYTAKVGDYVMKIQDCIYCITGNRKIDFIHLPQSQNNCMKIHVHRKPCSIAWRTSWEVGNQAGTAVCDVLTVCSPSPCFTCVICGESYIYTLFWGPIPQYTVSLSLSLVTHWFSLHDYHHHMQHQHPSSSYPEKE